MDHDEACTLCAPCTQDNTLKSLAAVAAEHMICVDVSFLGQSYCDVASLSDLGS